MRWCVAVICLVGGLWAAAVNGQMVAVRHPEGVLHGFLALRTLDGGLLAQGDLIQVPQGDRLNSQLIFHFKDGSIHDEEVTFSQRGTFRLISSKLVQKGPAFPYPIEMTINPSAGSVNVRSTDDGKPQTEQKQIDLPADLSNGMILTLLKNVGPNGRIPEIAFLAATSSPRLVKLAITKVGQDAILIAGARKQADHYVVHVKIGGFAGLLAPIIGKQPPDTHVWILPGEAPAFVRSEGPMYVGGPVWRIELTSPTWPTTTN